MHGINNIISVYLAPRDKYTFNTINNYFKTIKRKFAYCNINTAEEAKLIENNKRHKLNYIKPLKIGLGKYNKTYEQFYVNSPINAYDNYFHSFHNNKIDWYGCVLSKDNTSYNQKNNKHNMNIPETNMFYTYQGFRKNSVFEQLNTTDIPFNEALRNDYTTYNKTYKDTYLSLIHFYTNTNTNKYTQEEIEHKIHRQLMALTRTVSYARNNFLENNYKYLTNYYNKYIDTTIREMMKIEINIYFLKELLTTHPNLNIFVIGLNNSISRIQGILAEQTQNVIMSIINKNKTYFTYSLSYNHLLYHHNNWQEIQKFKKNYNDSIISALYGNCTTRIDHRYSSELMYDLILENDNKPITYYDSFGILHMSYDYSKYNNLKNKIIIV